MNAAGLTFILTGFSSVVGMPFYQSLVDDGSISQSELDGTRHNLTALIETLKKTPTEKIEALVAEYNNELTELARKFSAVGQTDTLGGLRNAQMMAGYATTIMARTGLRS